MTVANFKAELQRRKDLNIEFDKEGMLMKLAGDTERMAAFNEVFSEETKEEPPRRRGR